MLKELTVQTNSQTQFVIVDNQVNQVIQESGIQNGQCILWVPHTTAAVTINENADPDVVRDMIFEMNKIVPFNDGYRHMEGNSAAHIKSSLFGPSLSLIIEAGGLVLGTWQSIYFCEFDGPRRRRLYVKVMEG